jgi:nitrate reductase NapAB chaperone NapD
LYTLCQDEKANGPPLASLRAALDAAAFASLANHANVSSLAIHARKKYGQALRELNYALESAETATGDETLGAIVMLMLLEDINSERESLMSTHVSGIQYLLKLRGVRQLSDPATRSLFHFAFTQMVWDVTREAISFADPFTVDSVWRTQRSHAD